MSNLATNNLLKALQTEYRKHMNEITDHMAGGGCADISEYQRCVGIIQGLAYAFPKLVIVNELLVFDLHLETVIKNILREFILQITEFEVVGGDQSGTTLPDQLPDEHLGTEVFIPRIGPFQYFVQDHQHWFTAAQRINDHSQSFQFSIKC